MKKESPKISVVIPVYRVDIQLLERCLQGLENQTEQDFEVLLVFDEDISAYHSVVKRYQNRISGIRVMEREHQGVSAARNKGIQNAEGRWIAFVDADDWLEENALEVQMKAGEDQDADIVMGEHLMEYGNASQMHQYLKKNIVYGKDNKSIFEKDILKPQTGAGFVWGKLFRREFLVKNRIYFNEALSAAEDAEFMFRAACDAQKIIFITDICYHYRYNPTSAVRRYQTDYVDRYMRAMEALRQDIGERKDKEYCRETYYSCVLYHLLLIAVNYSFHPQAGQKRKEQMRAFGKLLKQPLFREALRHVHYKDFSKTRQITLGCIKCHFYFGVWVIARIRHRQFKQYSGN